MAFPNENPRHLDYLNMHGIPATELRTWKNSLLEFIRNLNYHYGKRIVLKSPPHTGRIFILREIFPNAKFLHIHRSPYDFIPSTIHMWASLDCANSFQLPHHCGLEDYVFSSFDRLYRGYFRDRHLLAGDNLANISYQQLCQDTVGTMQRIYEAWNLGEFEKVERRLSQWQKLNRDYVRNRHALPKLLRRKIDDHCGVYMQEFGYSQESAAA
jgi:hypothetical protein